MARFRVEAVLDKSSGLYLVEVYYPDNAQAPIIKTKPIYPSIEIAEKETLHLFKEAMKDQPIRRD